LFSFEKFKAERRGFYVIYAPLGKLFIDISYLPIDLYKNRLPAKFTNAFYNE